MAVLLVFTSSCRLSSIHWRRCSKLREVAESFPHKNALRRVCPTKCFGYAAGDTVITRATRKRDLRTAEFGHWSLLNAMNSIKLLMVKLITRQLYCQPLWWMSSLAYFYFF